MLQGGFSRRLSFFSGPAFPAGAVLPNGNSLTAVLEAVGQSILRSNLYPLNLRQKCSFVKAVDSEDFCGDRHQRVLWNHF